MPTPFPCKFQLNCSPSCPLGGLIGWELFICSEMAYVWSYRTAMPGGLWPAARFRSNNFFFIHGFKMPLLGAHMSMAGGYYKAVEIAQACGCDCVQLFTKNNNQWKGKEISPADAEKFKATLRELKISHPISHDSYLINLAAPDDELWKKSIDAFIIELQRAEQLGIPYVVAHPGAFTTSSEEAGLKKIIRALDEVHSQTKGIAAQCLLELTAGQGSTLGWKFEQMGTIFDGVKHPDRLGLCFDTCHVFAAGYPLQTEQEYKATMKQLDTAVGLDRIKAFHLNDSKKPLGSRVDRHEHIGQGTLGLEPFRHLMNDRRFKSIPMYLETPKGLHDGEEWDVTNLRVLRGLVEKATVKKISKKGK